MLLAVRLAMHLEFFEEGGFQGGFHAGERIVAQVGGQGVGQVGLKAGDPDAINLLFELGDSGHVRPVGGRRIRASVYSITAKTG
jgi:hypothetical protein